MHTFDTNAILYFIRNEEPAASRVREIIGEAPPYVSTVTELELFSFPSISEKEMLDLEQALLSSFVVPLNSNIARIAARLRREHGLKTPDSAIGATAIFTNSTLVTRNVRDFKKVPGLKVEAI